MKTIIAEGNSPELAFNGAFDFAIASNATSSFKRSQEDIADFAADYLESYAESVDGFGAYIVLREPKKAPVKTKFKVDNFINKGSRKWETITNFIDQNENTVLKYPSKGTTKSKSIAKAKELALELNTEITLVLTKQVSVGDPTIAKIAVNTDTNTMGKYYFFGIETIHGVDDIPDSTED
jgi:hypothetical protein